MRVRVHSMRRHEESFLWLALTLLAVVLVLALANQVAEARSGNAPAVLPAAIDQAARPLQDGNPVVPPFAPGSDLSVEVWRLLELHAQGAFEQALAEWPSVELPTSAAIWKQIAMSQALLATGRPDAAAVPLAQARESEPDNAVVHYYHGLLRLEQAERAMDWYDATRPQAARLVSYAPPQVSPNSRSMYRLAAMCQLQRAIEQAPMLDVHQPLTTPGSSSATLAAPTVADMLTALGADNYQGKSHHMLGRMLLEQGGLESAEQHMDEASALGMRIVFGYADLGRAYESRGRYVDAARAFGKAIQDSPDPEAARRDAARNLQRAMEDMPGTHP